MAFADIFKSSFLSNVGAVTPLDMALALVFSFGMGIFIQRIYKSSYAGVMYDSSFSVTLVSLTMITTILILAVTSNVVLSLGMVGALSIVRFRTAIKEPIEIVFLFWSIETGIVLAAGILPLAVIGNIIVGLILFFYSSLRENAFPYMLVIQCLEDAEESVDNLLMDIPGRYEIRSRTMRSVGADGVRTLELIVELRRQKESEIILISRDLSGISGVSSVGTVRYNGEYMS